MHLFTQFLSARTNPDLQGFDLPFGIANPFESGFLSLHFEIV